MKEFARTEFFMKIKNFIGSEAFLLENRTLKVVVVKEVIFTKSNMYVRFGINGNRYSFREFNINWFMNKSDAENELAKRAERDIKR